MERILKLQIRDYVKTFFRPLNLMSVPEVVARPPGNNVLVLSPHLDDEVFGCGGTLYKHTTSGNKVAVVYFTDGREGDPSEKDKTLVERVRKEEARRATRLLGIDDLTFLDEPESRLCPTPKLVSRLAEILSRIKPDLIYLPSFLENHVDHFELNRLLLFAASEVRLRCNVCAFELWTPIIPNLIVDITEVMAKKKEAAEQYQSQIKQVDYVGVMLGIGRYRSVSVMQGRGYAEAFLFASFEEYVGLMKRLGVGRPRYFFDRKHKEFLKKMVGLVKWGNPQDRNQGAPKTEAP